MNRGACLGSAGAKGDAFAAGAGGAAGLAGTADGGATLWRDAGGATGADGCADTCGWAFCVIAFSTSPGLEMCDKSILGLNSSAGALLRELRVEPGSPCCR